MDGIYNLLDGIAQPGQSLTCIWRIVDVLVDPVHRTYQ